MKTSTRDTWEISPSVLGKFPPHVTVKFSPYTMKLVQIRIIKILEFVGK